MDERLLLLVSLLVCGVSMDAAATPGKLVRTLVILDPGHGGLDDGAHGTIGTQQIVEDEHVFDVALRVRDMVRRDGGLVAMTIEDATQHRPIDNAPGTVLPVAQQSERIAVREGHDCTVLRGGTTCLRARLVVASWALQKYRMQYNRVVWISIHFDHVGAGVAGAVIVVPSEGPTPASVEIARVFEELPPDRTRTVGGVDVPVLLRSGDHDHGIRNLYVLGRQNPVKDRMLIELGNFQNDQDRWRIRDHAVRMDFARKITLGLIAWRAARPSTLVKR